MTVLDLFVPGAGIALIAFLLWFFFGSKHGKAAVIQGGVQEATIRVKGAYQPNVLTVKAGTPVCLKFDRREATDCSNRVVLPDFGISRALPAFATTAIEFTPQQPGEYPFACAMNMYRGTMWSSLKARRLKPTLPSRRPRKGPRPLPPARTPRSVQPRPSS